MHIKNNTPIDIMNSYLNEEEPFYNTWYKNIKNSRFSPFKTEEKLTNKENIKIEKIINYLNNSNKLPNINKEIPVEFRGFSKEEIRQREKTEETGYSIYLTDEQKIIVDENEVRSLSEHKFWNSDAKPINKQDAANYLFLHELGHAVHHQWSLANQGKVTEVTDKNDEQFINQMVKFEGFKDIPCEQLHSLHSSILEGYADLYACSMIREIYTENGQKERGEELIKSIIEFRSDSYKESNLKEGIHKYDVVDNLKLHNSAANSKIQYKDFNDLNKKIMETNTAIGIKKFDDKLREYTKPSSNNDERIRNEFFYLTSFVNNRIYDKDFQITKIRNDTIAMLESRINDSFQMDTCPNSIKILESFNNGRKFANKDIHSGVINEQKETPKRVRPSISNNSNNTPSPPAYSGKRPTLDSHIKENNSSNAVTSKEMPRIFSDRALPPENTVKGPRPTLNPEKSQENPSEERRVRREIPKLQDRSSLPVKKEENKHDNQGLSSGKHKI